MVQTTKRNKKNAATLKMAITVASVTATLGAWAHFSSQDVNTAQADQPQQLPTINQGVNSTDGTGDSSTTITPDQGTLGNSQFGSLGQPSDGTGTSTGSNLNSQSQSNSFPSSVRRSHSSR